MYITLKMLRDTGAFPDAIRWLKENFPNGYELEDDFFAKLEKQACPASFIWWIYNHIKRDVRLYELCGVNNSDAVDYSTGVRYSHGVIYSSNIESSNGVRYSSNVTRSNGVSSSGGVGHSCGVNHSLGVECSEGVSNSFFIDNCSGVSGALFLADKPRTYSIFGKSVPESRFNEVKNQLFDLLNGWLPTFGDIKELPTKKAWCGMPKAAIDYVRSLPEFDAQIFQQVTGICPEPQ